MSKDEIIAMATEAGLNSYRIAPGEALAVWKRFAALASPLTKLQRKAIAVCFTSDKVSVSEVQRQLSISYADAQTLCQSIVDLGLTDELELAPSLKRGAPASQPAPVAQGDALSDDAVRVPLDSLHADAAYLIGRLREGSMPYARAIEIIRERIDAAKAAIRARAAQGDALDAARYRWLRDGEWRDTDLEPFIRLQLNTLRDAKIDAARAAQEDKSHE